MSEQIKVSMMLCSGLEPDEQEKVERLDVPISERIWRAGLVARVCEASGSGDSRVLRFCEPTGTVVGTIRAFEFLSASDPDAVAKIVLRNS